MKGQNLLFSHPWGLWGKINLPFPFKIKIPFPPVLTDPEFGVSLGMNFSQFQGWGLARPLFVRGRSCFFTPSWGLNFSDKGNPHTQGWEAFSGKELHSRAREVDWKTPGTRSTLHRKGWAKSIGIGGNPPFFPLMGFFGEKKKTKISLPSSFESHQKQITLFPDENIDGQIII